MADRPAWGRRAEGFEALPKDWARLRRRVLRKSVLCHVCRMPGATEVDHIVPRAAGGTHDLSNLAPIHSECHRRKTSRESAALVAARRAATRRPVERHPGLAS